MGRTLSSSALITISDSKPLVERYSYYGFGCLNFTLVNALGLFIGDLAFIY